MRMRVHDTHIPGPNAPLTLMDRLPFLILPGCILFNFFLCLIHTLAFDVSVPMIIACEIVLVGVSAFYGFFQINRAKLYWLAIIGVQITLMLLLSLARDEFLMKPIRDMIIMPVFVVLGLSAARLKLTSFLLWMGAIIIAVAMWEGFALENFTQYFNIRKYYVGKGVIGEDMFIPADLIVSGFRPNESYLLDLPFHRLSSVFLEPVSLGFFGFIIGLYFTAMKRNLSLPIFLLGLVISYTLIVISDARMAFMSLTLMLMLRPLIARIDHRFAFLVFPGILFVAFIIYITQVFGTSGEGIGWRVDDTMKKLSVMSFDLFLGLSTDKYYAEDSALLKIFQFQGVLGILLYWLSPIFFMRHMNEEPRIYLFGITMFLSFGFIISSAILTIKTAALLWFLYGYLVAWTIKRDEDLHDKEINDRAISAA
jgi:putative polymerase